MDLMDPLMLLLLLLLSTPALAALREFHFVNLLKTWTEAQSYCREKFFDLATIENAEDWARVSEMVENSGQTHVWIGMYDDVNSWRWSLDNTPEQELGSWYRFFVNNNSGNNHCGSIKFVQGLYDSQCDNSWKSLCYDETSNSYIKVTDPKTWQEAQSYCRQTYTDLASIRNQQELNNILNVVDINGVHWIGSSRESWKWSDQSDSSFREWGPGEPHGGREACGGAFLGGLFNAPCEWGLPFLCSVLPTPALTVPREFHLVTLMKTWTEAQSYCRENFDDLVTIESADDWLRVIEIVKNLSNWGLWIGLYDDVNSWRWSLDNTSLNEQQSDSWFRFFVNNHGGNQHCGSFKVQQNLINSQCDNLFKSVCYNETANSYIPVTDLKTWQDAQSYCRQTYTDLASIRNQQELNNVMRVVEPGLAHWIGLFRESWKWSDQSDSSFREWMTGEPDGGSAVCGGAAVDGLFDGLCHVERPFICSAPQRKLLKVTLKTDGSVNLNDPLVQEAILKQMEKDLKGQGVHQEFRFSWRKQPHGDVFNKTEQ